MKRITVLIYVLICMSSALYPQLEKDHLKNIIPPSPNAASIARYGEIPVRHFTCVPNVNIPIYTVKSGELTLSLNYHSCGNKVESIVSVFASMDQKFG